MLYFYKICNFSRNYHGKSYTLFIILIALRIKTDSGYEIILRNNFQQLTHVLIILNSFSKLQYLLRIKIIKPDLRLLCNKVERIFIKPLLKCCIKDDVNQKLLFQYERQVFYQILYAAKKSTYLGTQSLF